MPTASLHIFRAGRHTDMSGREIDFTEADLAASAAVYDPALHEAPIVVGHPKHDAPAYGWVSSLAATGADLTAAPRQVDPEFAEMVDAGRFKKISASFYLPDAPNNPAPGNYYLRHVGFLGAQAPSVKGLKAVAFGEGEEGVVEFGDFAASINATLWRRLREWLLAKFDQTTADQVAPNWDIEALSQAARDDDNDRDVSAAPGLAYSDPAIPPQETAVTPQEKAALEAENTRLKEQLAVAQAKEKAAQASARHASHLSYAETLVDAGQLAPKHRELVAAVLDFSESSEGVTPLEFGEGDEKQSLAAAFKAFLAELPKAVEFGEVATKDRAPTPPANPLVANAEARAAAAKE